MLNCRAFNAFWINSPEVSRQPNSSPDNQAERASDELKKVVARVPKPDRQQ